MMSFVGTGESCLTGLIRYNLTIKIHFRIKYIAVKQLAKPIAKETSCPVDGYNVIGIFLKGL